MPRHPPEPIIRRPLYLRRRTIEGRAYGIEGALFTRTRTGHDDGQPSKSAIVTMRSTTEDMTPEEHQRRGDAADALFRRT
jgi:hypothetical protein